MQRWSPLVLLFVVGLATAVSGAVERSSGDLEQDEAWSANFDEEGVYSYFCLPHPWMEGNVTVVPQGTAGASNGTIEVRIVDFLYDDDEVTIEAGSTVRWTNEDAEAHTVELSGADEAAREEAAAWVAFVVYGILVLVLGGAGFGMYLAISSGPPPPPVSQPTDEDEE